MLAEIKSDVPAFRACSPICPYSLTFFVYFCIWTNLAVQYLCTGLHAGITVGRTLWIPYGSGDQIIVNPDHDMCPTYHNIPPVSSFLRHLCVLAVLVLLPTRYSCSLPVDLREVLNDADIKSRSVMSKAEMSYCSPLSPLWYSAPQLDSFISTCFHL